MTDATLNFLHEDRDALAQGHVPDVGEHQFQRYADEVKALCLVSRPGRNPRGRRDSQASSIFAATASATLLFVDAWFDVLTSSSRAEFVVSIGEAAFVELPLAILCLLLAREAERRLRVPPLSRSTSARPRLRLVDERPPREPFPGADRVGG